MYCRWLEIDEELLIGGDIVIKAMEGRKGKIRIGIQAPDSIAIIPRRHLVSQLSKYMKLRRSA